MDTKVNYAAVGTFVIALLAAIIFGIIWLSAGITIERYTIYKVYMNESVSGLNIDSAVEYNGVDSGNLISMNISKKDPQLIELLLRIKADTPITEGTRAMLNSRGITGTTFVGLQDKGTDLTPLKPTPDEQYPVIKTSPSLFLRLDTALSDLASNMRQVAAEIKIVLSPKNQKAWAQTLDNMSKITGTISANNQQLQSILQNTSNSMQLFQEQTLPAANQAITNLDLLTRNLSDFSRELKQNPAILIRGKTQQPLGPGEQ